MNYHTLVYDNSAPVNSTSCASIALISAAFALWLRLGSLQKPLIDCCRSKIIRRFSTDSTARETFPSMAASCPGAGAVLALSSASAERSGYDLALLRRVLGLILAERLDLRRRRARCESTAVPGGHQLLQLLPECGEGGL